MENKTLRVFEIAEKTYCICESLEVAKEETERLKLYGPKRIREVDFLSEKIWVSFNMDGDGAVCLHWLTSSFPEEEFKIKSATDTNYILAEVSFKNILKLWGEKKFPIILTDSVYAQNNPHFALWESTKDHTQTNNPLFEDKPE